MERAGIGVNSKNKVVRVIRILVERTWAPVGQTPQIRYNFNWKKLSAMAGITLDGKIYFRVYEERSIKKEEVIQYLNQLLRQIPGYIVV